MGRCTVRWSRSLFKIALLGQFLRVPRDFEIFHDRLFWQGQRNDVTTLILWEFQLSACNLVRWCAIAWSISLYKEAMLGQFLPVPWTGSERRRYCFNSLRISAIGLKFGGMMHSMIKQITIRNGRGPPNAGPSAKLWDVQNRLGPGPSMM